jgi:hypothetical protein
MEHLTNCHGEWNFLFAMCGSLPFISVWAKSKFWRDHEEDHSCKSAQD